MLMSQPPEEGKTAGPRNACTKGFVERIMLLGLRGPISPQDAGIVMLWLLRQPQVAAIGLEEPTLNDVLAMVRLRTGAP
jgi:hypothetical protein